MTTTTIKRVAFLLVVPLFSACIPEPVPNEQPAGGGPPAATQVVLLDTSGSVLATDIPTKAQNKVTELADQMAVDTQIVVRALNSNVTAMCDDLVISLPPQPSEVVEQQVRDANKAAIPQAFANYITCSTGQAVGGTEFWGGVAEIYATYPTIGKVYAYSDTCDNVTIRPGTCNAKHLRNGTFPNRVVAQLSHDGLVPHAQPGSTIQFVGVGRNTRLSAVEITALRKIATLWAKRAGATATFATQ